MTKKRRYNESRSLPSRVLTAEEEIKLGRIVRKSAPDSSEYNAAFKELLECNLRLVAKEAYEIAKKTGMDADDLMGEGYLGLVHAIEKYDPDQFTNARFATYALHWIRQKMYGYSYNGLIVHVPRNVVVQLSNYHRIMSEQPEGSISREEICAKLNVTERELKLIEQADVKNCSIFSEYDGNGSNPSFDGKKPILADLIVDNSDDPARVAVLTDRANVVEKLLDSYPKREKDIVFSYLMDDEKISLQSMAKKYKLSRERIRQIKEGVLRDMREKLKQMRFGDVI